MQHNGDWLVEGNLEPGGGFLVLVSIVMMTDGPPCYLGHFLTRIGYLPSVWDLAGKCHHNSSLEAALSSSSPSSLKRSLSSLSSNVQNELEAKIFLKCL